MIEADPRVSLHRVVDELSGDDCRALLPIAQVLRSSASAIGPDEAAVLTQIARRLALGASQYGRLRIASDGRDWRKEASEEYLDGAVYMAIQCIKERE